jgi:hypothetical protein
MHLAVCKVAQQPDPRARAHTHAVCGRVALPAYAGPAYAFYLDLVSRCMQRQT